MRSRVVGGAASEPAEPAAASGPPPAGPPVTARKPATSHRPGLRPGRPGAGLFPLLFGLVVGLASTSTALVAARPPPSIEPGAVNSHSSATRKYYDLQKQLEKKPEKPENNVTNQTRPSRPGTPKTAGTRFLLKKVEMNKSALLTAAEIRGITRQYEGREVGMRDLAELVRKINALYAAKGYITAHAVLPPQKVVGGVVRIELVEGRVGKVTVEDHPHTDAAYIRARVPLAPGEIVQVKTLENRLVYFNRTNDIRVRAILQPGAKFGTTDVRLRVAPVDNSSTVLWYDNAGYDSIGRQRVGLTQRWKSLTGHRDPLTVGGYWAEGTVAGFASYDYPVTVRGTRLGAAVSYDRIQVRSGPLEPLGVKGHFYDASLRWSRPFVVSRRFLFQGSVAPHYQSSTLESSSVPVSRERVKSLVFGGDLQSIDRHGVWYVQSNLTLGSHNLGGSNFFAKYDAAITRWEQLGAGFVALFRVNGQARLSASTPLPPSEQIQLGGLSTVRGYPEGELIGDNGYLLSAELDSPLPLGSREFHGMPLKDRFKLALFVDHGAIIGSPGNRYATSVGTGLIINLSRYLTGRLDLATPLQDRQGLGRWTFEFHLQTSPDLARLFRGHRGHR